MGHNAHYIIVNRDNISLAIKHLLSVKDEVFGFDTEIKKDGTLQFIQIYSPVSKQSFIFSVDEVDLTQLISVLDQFNVVGHNLQFDLSICLKQFGKYPNPVADTFLLSCSLQEEQKGLKPLCNQYFGYPLAKWEDLFGDYDYTMTEAKWQYVANDPYYTWLLLDYYKQTGAFRFVKKAHEMDIKAMVHYMESSLLGVLIDQTTFNEYLSQYTSQVNELQDKLNLYAGWEVRTTSTKDLKKLLFEQMELPTPPITTDKGEVSVSKEALSYLPDKDGIITLIGQIKESRSVLSSMNNL